MQGEGDGREVEENAPGRVDTTIIVMVDQVAEECRTDTREIQKDQATKHDQGSLCRPSPRRMADSKEDRDRVMDLTQGPV